MSTCILVINDDDSLLELFKLVLEPEGYDVHLSGVTYEDMKHINSGSRYDLNFDSWSGYP